MNLILNVWTWIGAFIGFLILNGIFLILIFFIFKWTHLKTELKAFWTKTPIGLFYTDNKFVDWRPVAPVNGIVYDNKYGPFLVSKTYVAKKTKNIIIPFDVDMDGDRKSNMSELIHEFSDITQNEKNVRDLRIAVNSEDAPQTKNLKNLTSFIKFANLKDLFMSTSQHNIKSKIEKMVAVRVAKYQNVNPMQAVIVFGAIFGIIIGGLVLLKIFGPTMGLD